MATISFNKRVPPGAAGGGTLQALMKRQQDAAAAKDKAMTMPGPLPSPWQGAAEIGNVIGAGIREGRAQNQEAQARQQLAELMSKVGHEGSTPEMEAQIAVLDPELAAQYRAEAIEARRTAAATAEAARLHEDTQAHDTLEGDKTRSVTTSEGAANRAVTTRAQDIGHEEFGISSAETKRANLAGENGAAAQREETRRSNLAGENGEAARLEETKRSNLASETNQAATLAETSIHNRAGEEIAAGQLDIETQKLPGDLKKTAVGTQFGPIKKGAELGLTGEMAEQPFQQDSVTQEWKPVVTSGSSTNVYTGEGGAFTKEGDKLAAQDYTDIVKTGRESVPFMSQLKIVADLGKNIGTGKGAELVQRFGPYAQMLGLDMEIFSGLDEGQAYKAIVDKLAPKMRVVGAGASSDFDARQFLSSLPALGRTPEGNKLINDTFAAISQHQQAAGEIANQALLGKMDRNEAEAKIRALPDPYETFRTLRGSGAEAVPADGGEAPVFDPATDAEGDTGEDETGKWIVRNGQWVRQ